MKRVVLFAVGMVCLGSGVGLPSSVAANPILLNCTPGLCVTSVASQIKWSFEPHNGGPMHFPHRCEDKASCIFFCPSGLVDVHVTLRDSDGTIIGGASTWTACPGGGIDPGVVW